MGERRAQMEDGGVNGRWEGRMEDGGRELVIWGGGRGRTWIRGRRARKGKGAQG
jgi:hypothetical protein